MYIEYEMAIYDGDKLSKGEIKEVHGSHISELPNWFKELGNHFGEKCKTDGGEGRLIGISYTNENYYYLVERNSKVWHDSAAGKIKFV